MTLKVQWLAILASFNTHIHVLRPTLRVCRCIWYDRKQLKQTVLEREALSTPISITNKQCGSGIFPREWGPDRVEMQSKLQPNK